MREKQTIRQMVWEAMAFELEAEAPIRGLPCFASDIVDTVWEWYSEELRATGYSKDAVQPVVIEVMDHIEAHGWDTVREEFQEAARARDPVPEQPVQRRTEPMEPPF